MTKTSKSEKRLAKQRPSARLPLGLSLPLLAGIICPGVSSAQEEPVPGTYFEKAPEAFSSQPCQYFRTEGGKEVWKEGCFTHWLQMSDLDSDGDLDVLFASGGGYFALGESEPSAIYLNDGGASLLYVSDTHFGGAMSRSRQIAVADIDCDGDKDIYQPGSWGADSDKLWVQTSPGVWEDRAAQLLPGSLLSRYTAAAFGDIDGDGDLDLTVADWGNNPNKGANTSVGNVRVYVNDGTGAFTLQPSYVVPAPMPLVLNEAAGVGAADWGNTPLDIDLADVDGDFDLDIVLLHRNGRGRIFLNDGTGLFSDATESYPAKTRAGAYSYNTELCDIDGDGDLDMLTDNAGARDPEVTRGAGTTRLLINDGLGAFEEQTTTRIFGEAFGDDNAVKCADVNGDGHYDLVVSTLSSGAEELLLNDGTGKFNKVAGAFTSTSDPSLGLGIADLNGDGILDVITGQGELDPQLNMVHLGGGLSARDVTPPKFRAVEQPVAVEPGQTIVLRMGVVDAHTSETGEHVKSVTVTYQVGEGAETKLPAYFIGGDLFRVEIPAQPAGSVITVKPSAIDRQDLVSEAFSFTIKVKGEVEQPGGDGDGDGDSTTPGGDGDGDSTTPGGDGDGDSTTPGGDGDGDGVTPKPEPTTSKSSDGCSVSGPGSSNSAGLFAMLGLALLGLRARRRLKLDR